MRIGTNDPNPGDYANWVMPAGWQEEIVSNQDRPNTGNATNAPWVVHFFTTLVTDSLVSGINYTFGFDNPNDKVMENWSTRSSYFINTDPLGEQTMSLNDAGLCTNVGAWVYDGSPEWADATNLLGEAGVWGPVPEPSTIVLLGVGAASVVIFAWRRRKRAA